ncbi:MAG: hypothetical protein V4628_01225 [Pseudomonadota bacterium]
MHKPSVSLVLLAFFTTAEKAEEIEGDLLEQAQIHGKPWFILHVFLTALALGRQTLLQQPLLVLLPGYAVYELVVKLQLWAILPLRRYLQYELDYPATLLLFSTRFVWIITGYLVGMALIRYLPKTGIHVAIGAATLIMARVVMLNEVSSISALLFLVMPILLGGFHAKSRNLHEQTRSKNLISD